MAKKLVFTQVTDERFNENDMDLINIHNELMEKLSNYECLKVSYSRIKEIQFDANKQWRIDYSIEKQGRKLTWNNVYELINSVKVVSFNFK